VQCCWLQEDLWSTMCNILIREAGHLVPLNKPSEGFALMETFLQGNWANSFPHTDGKIV
jgi:carboxypeptidase C (cathepsin A)